MPTFQPVGDGYNLNQVNWSNSMGVTLALPCHNGGIGQFWLRDIRRGFQVESSVGYQFRVEHFFTLRLVMNDQRTHIPFYFAENQMGSIAVEDFIFHLRHNLHLPLSIIAQLVGRNADGSTPTASSIGARYLRYCTAYGVGQPYLSATQQRNRLTRTHLSGRSRRNDDALLEIPDYLSAEVQVWFSNIDVSFGHELEVMGLSVSRGISTLSSLPDVQSSTDGHYRHTVSSEWKVVPDASVSSGCEVVSPPMRNGSTDFLQVRRVMFAIKQAGARITRACGGHVHFGVEQLTPDDRARTVEAHHYFQPMFDSFVNANRRGFQTFTNPRSRMEMEMICHEFITNINTPIRDANGNTVARGEVQSHSARYRNWNVCSWGKYGTFENRQLEGCLNPRKMFAWLSLNRAFIQACCTSDNFELGQQPLLANMQTMLCTDMLDRVAELTEMPESVKVLIKSYFTNL